MKNFPIDFNIGENAVRRIAPSLLIKSSSNLQEPGQTSWNSSQIGLHFGVTCPLVPKNTIFYLVRSIACLVLPNLFVTCECFDLIVIKLAGNQDRHKILDTCRILARSDQSLWSYLPLNAWKNVVNTIAPLLVESSSNLLVTRAGLKSPTSLILGQIGQFTLALLALEQQNFLFIA